MRVLSTNTTKHHHFTEGRPTVANANDLTGWKITANETQSAKSIGCRV